MTYREPEWSRDDVVALAAVVERREMTGSHGHPITDAMSPDGDPSRMERKWDWHVPLPSVDFAQRAIDRARDAYARKYPEADMGAMRWRVEKQQR